MIRVNDVENYDSDAAHDDDNGDTGWWVIMVILTPVSYTHLDVYKRQHRHWYK